MPTDPTARQVADLIARYTAEMADAITTCRRKLCARVPRGYELVYDNYNALAIGGRSLGGQAHGPRRSELQYPARRG
jgi:hypothetical protein